MLLNFKVSFLGAFIAGASSGGCSTVLFQPFDVVKTRLQENATVSTVHRFDLRGMPVFVLINNVFVKGRVCCRYSVTLSRRKDPKRYGLD